jgi:hypothetical protein
MLGNALLVDVDKVYIEPGAVVVAVVGMNLALTPQVELVAVGGEETLTPLAQVTPEAMQTRQHLIAYL